MGTLEPKWGPNGDPKTEKGPHGDRVPQMGTHVATVDSPLPLTDGPWPKKLTERGGTPLPPSRQFPGLGLLNPSLSVLSTLITSQVPRPTSRERTPWALRAGNFTSEASSTENVD